MFPSHLAVAFKEWASVCAALGAGRQTVLYRKGGIAEAGGVFKPEHVRFWLYPTYFHEREQNGLKAGHVNPMHHESGRVTLRHIAEVIDIQWLDNLATLLADDAEHIWNAETLTQRFQYRTPGLYRLRVRVFTAQAQVIDERPEYAGCKSWVQLAEAVPVIAPVAVMNGEAMRAGTR